MSETLKGECLCDGIEYELTDPEGFGICHCSRCQRWTGSSLAAVLVDPDNFRITKGEDLVSRYESELAPRHFCSNCGASVYDDLGGKYFVAAGLMRELPLKPDFHMQVAYKAHWDEIGGDAPQYDENPPG
ncbi:MAG TPA: GFA family protein [Solirubrobacterales bacterium]|jgi:hypothetical protein|nr:GFA family protein [Solirubrobacterales bacterium]